MTQKISLKEIERKAFRKAHDDGLWDIFLGCFLLMFAIAPYLSVYLGDFWSSAVFLPFWGIVFLAIFLIRKHIVVPRVGIVKFGPLRKKKLMVFSLLMLLVNAFSLILGLILAFNFGLIPGYLPMLTMGLIFLTGFSLAAYFLDIPRLYFYGLLVGFSPLVGEWFYIHESAAHHGLPITFGFSSGIMILIGAAIFIRFLFNNPVPIPGTSSENA